jgi:1-acyl-sn-glycerol-3-phosphate acyltransferase
LVFSAGTLFLVLAVLPGLRLFHLGMRLFHRPGPDRELAVQRIVHRAFRCFLLGVRALGLVRVVWVGAERLRTAGPLLVVANHPSLIDVILLVACMPQVDCVVKQTHWRRPLMRRLLTAAGYVSNADGDALVETCVERLRQGRSVLLFPEGTRSPPGRLGLFRRGVAHISLRSGCDPVPVVIRCDRPFLLKSGKWHEVPDGMVEFTVEVHHPFAVQRSREAGAEPQTARGVTAAIRDLYEDLLCGSGSCRGLNAWRPRSNS